MANAAKKLEVVPVDETGTDIVVAVNANPGIVLLDGKKFDAFYEKLKADADAVPVDLTTDKGRKAIASIAATIRSEKAAIDKDRLRLTKEWRDMTAQVNDAWKGIETRLNGLALDVRAPLTQWEEREKAKNENRRRIIDEMRAFGVVTMDDTSQTVRDRGSEVYKTEVTPALYEDMYDEAASVKAQTVETLKNALARLIKEEADRAELEKLRAAETERLRVEAEKEAAAEIERKEIEAARIEEERKAAAEKADAERIANAERAAAEKVQREIEEKHAQELSRINQGREMLSYIREVVAGRIGGQVQPFGVLLRELESKVVVIGEGYGDMEAEIERARIDGLASLNDAMERQAARAQAEEDRAAERARLELEHERQQNKANRAAKKTAAKQAIMTCGASEEVAQKIVLAIIAGEIPAVALAF